MKSSQFLALLSKGWIAGQPATVNTAIDFNSGLPTAIVGGGFSFMSAVSFNASNPPSAPLFFASADLRPHLVKSDVSTYSWRSFEWNIKKSDITDPGNAIFFNRPVLLPLETFFDKGSGTNFWGNKQGGSLISAFYPAGYPIFHSALLSTSSDTKIRFWMFTDGDPVEQNSDIGLNFDGQPFALIAGPVAHAPIVQSTIPFPLEIVFPSLTYVAAYSTVGGGVSTLPNNSGSPLLTFMTGYSASFKSILIQEVRSRGMFARLMSTPYGSTTYPAYLDKNGFVVGPDMREWLTFHNYGLSPISGLSGDQRSLGLGNVSAMPLLSSYPVSSGNQPSSPVLGLVTLGSGTDIIDSPESLEVGALGLGGLSDGVSMALAPRTVFSVQETTDDSLTPPFYQDYPLNQPY